MRRTLFLVIAAVLLLPRTSAAQDTPRFGLVIGYPAQAGVLWTVSDRVAVRPEISWSRSSLESTTTLITFGPVIIPGTETITRTSRIDGWQVGIGVSGLLYLSKGDALRTYVSPRFSYSRSSTTTDFVSPLPITATPTTTATSTYGAAGSLGAQYALGKRFGVFAELGLAYSRSGRPSTSAPSFVESDTTGWTLALRSGVGVILYFGS